MTCAEYRGKLMAFETRHGVRNLMDRRQRSPRIYELRALWYCVLRGAGLSYPEIGRLVGRDHSTVLKMLQRHGYRRLQGPHQVTP